MPLISIVTVALNNKHGLCETLNSVHSQTLEEKELIVIDGGSNDGSPELIKKYNPHLAYWTSEPDQGLYDAMNKGLEKCKGDFVIFMNAGDIFFDSSVLQIVATHLKSNQLNACRCLITDGKSSWHHPPKEISNYNWQRLLPAHQAVFYPRIFYKTNKYKLDLGHSGDSEYTLRCIHNHGISFIDAIVATFRLGGMSGYPRSAKQLFFMIQCNKRLYKAYPAYFTFFRKHTPLLRLTAKFFAYKLFGGFITHQLQKYHAAFRNWNFKRQ